MLSSDQPSKIFYPLLKLPAILLALSLSTTSIANDGGFIGVYMGSSSSLDTGNSSESFKILTGAHITSRISLEFGYVNFGATSYDNPTAINVDNKKSNISFADARHGSISSGQLGDATVVADGRDTYDKKGSGSFTGISKFAPEGGLINLRYRFPILDSLDFFVKTGFFAWAADYETVKITAAQPTLVQIAAGQGPIITSVAGRKTQTSGVNAISGGGFIYRPIPQLSLRAELESTAISSADMPRTRFQNISFGANWEF